MLSPLPTPPPRAAESGPPPPPRDGMRRYEDLDGAEGRAVFFRPHRHTAVDLAPLDCAVIAVVDGVRHRCALRDVSQNGVGFSWPEGLAVAPDQRIDVELRFEAHVAFRGEARVVSVRQQDGVTVVGISFQEFLLDLDEVLQLRDVQRWRASAERRHGEGPAWQIFGCRRYKAAIAELRLFFQDAQRDLDALERLLPWHVLHGETNPAREALVAHLSAEFVPEAIRLSEQIDEAVRELPGAHSDPAAREWSRRYVDEFLLQAPGAHRARHKPFGYPGDYEVMNFIYGRPFEGASLFGRAVELAFWHSRCSLAVRARKDLMTAEIARLLESRAGADAPVRVLSIASGPAQEFVDLLMGTRELPAPLEVVLFEQDKGALAQAWRRLAPLVARFPGRVRLTCLHDSIKRLLRDRTLFAPLGGFDLVYSVGLLDYLQQFTAVAFVRNLFSSVRPGGKLLVANMVDHPARWYLEVPLEWPLVYRTRGELLELGQRAVPAGAARVLEEDSGANPFLEIVRT